MRPIWIMAGLAGIIAAPAFAHHSFDMFDAERTVTIQGTVKEFEWRNPHAWLPVLVDSEKSGKPVDGPGKISANGAAQHEARITQLFLVVDRVQADDFVFLQAGRCGHLNFIADFFSEQSAADW